MTWTQVTADTWTAWTPVVTGETNPFVAHPTGNIYKKAGDLVIVRFQLSVGSTVGAYDYWKMSLPVIPKQVSGYTACGEVYMWSDGPSNFGSVALHSTSHVDSTVEFIPQVSKSGTLTDIPRLPLGPAPSGAVSLSGKFFYEAA